MCNCQSWLRSRLVTGQDTKLAPNFWMNKIQNCLHVLQRNHIVSLPLIVLSCYTFTVLPALSALRQTHACSKSNASTAKPMAFALSHILAPTSATISPKTSGTLLLSLPSKANSRHFFSQNISVKPHCPSLLSVCTVCVCVFCIVTCDTLSICFLFLITFSISMCIMCMLVQRFEPQGKRFTNVYYYYYYKCLLLFLPLRSIKLNSPPTLGKTLHRPFPHTEQSIFTQHSHCQQHGLPSPWQPPGFRLTSSMAISPE